MQIQFEIETKSLLEIHKIHQIHAKCLVQITLM